MDRTTKTELSHMVDFTGLVFPDAAKQIKVLVSLVMILMGWITVSLDVVSRHTFGERYVNPVRLYMGWGFTSTAFYLLMLSQQPVILYALFNLAYIGLCGWHHFRIWQRNRKGIPWHSMSFGVSRLEKLIPVSDWMLYRFIEPIVFFGLGYALYRFDTLGYWLMFASFFLLIRNNLVYGEMRDKYLDVMDATIEASYLQVSQNGASKQQAAGIATVKLPHVVEEVLEDLSPPPAPATGTKPPDLSASLSEHLKQD